MLQKTKNLNKRVKIAKIGHSPKNLKILLKITRDNYVLHSYHRPNRRLHGFNTAEFRAVE